jgi:hypothetical protein
VPLVIASVFVAIPRVQLGEPADDGIQRSIGGGVQYERADFGTQEVIRAGGAERGQARVLSMGEELQHRVTVGEMADLAVVGARKAPYHRSQSGGRSWR